MFLNRYFKSCLEVIKQPVRLIPTALLGVIWIGLGFIGAYLKELPVYLKVISFLTYAQGGLYGGDIAAAGGILGRIITASFLNALIIPFFDKRTPFSGIGGGIKGFFSGAAIRSLRDAVRIFGGCGTALLLYSFMNSRQNLQESLVGIVSIIFILDNIGKKNGLISCLVFDVLKLFSGGKTPSFVDISRFLSGLTIGFTMAIALSASPFKFCRILGILFMLASLVLSLFGKKTKKIIPQGAAMIFAVLVGAGAVCPFVMLSYSMSVFAADERWVEPYTHFGVNSVSELNKKMKEAGVYKVKYSPTLIYEAGSYMSLESEDPFIVDLKDKEETVRTLRILSEDDFGDSEGYIDLTLTFTGDSRRDALFRVRADWEEHLTPNDGWFYFDDEDTGTGEETVTSGTTEDCTISFTDRFEDQEFDTTFMTIDFGRSYSIELTPQQILVAGKAKGKEGPDPSKIAGTYKLIFRDKESKTKGEIEINIDVTYRWMEATYSGDNGIIGADHILCGIAEEDPEYYTFNSLYVKQKDLYIQSVENETVETISALNLAIDNEIEDLMADGKDYFLASSMTLWFDTTKDPYTVSKGILSLRKAYFDHDKDDEFLEFWYLETEKKMLPKGSGNGGNKKEKNSFAESLDELIDIVTAGGEAANVHRDENGTIIITFVGGIISIFAGSAGGAAGAGAAAGAGGSLVSPGDADLGPHIFRDKDGDLVATDPATGEKKTYVSNGDGTYTNPLTDVTYTPGELKENMEHRAEHSDQYREDYVTEQSARKEQREANRYLSKDGIDYLNQKHADEARFKREEYNEKMWMKHGGERGDAQSIRNSMVQDQNRNLVQQQEAQDRANKLDYMVKGLEATQVVADVSVDVIAGLTGQQGIKNAYVVGRNYASRLSDAYVNNKDLSGAFAMAGFDSLTDIGLDKVSSAGYHISGNVSAELIKNTTQNLYDGKDWNKDWEKAAISGTAKGTIAKITGAFSDAQKAKTKADLNRDYDLIVIADQSGASEKSLRAMQDIRLLTYVNNWHAERTVGAISTAAGDLGGVAVDKIKENY